MLVSLFRKCCIIGCEIASMESSLILILILEFEYLHNTFNKWRPSVSISIVLNSKEQPGSGRCLHTVPQ